MTDHDHHGHSHHHRHAGAVHPPAATHPSILRLSGFHRLGFAAAVVALLWLAVFWAMR